MISSAKLTEGFPTTLPALAGKTFVFKVGVTIVFGPNGCGKSTLLSFMAAFSGCGREGGWSKPLEPSWLRDKGYPAAFASNAPKRLMAEIEWDGTASFLHTPASDAPMTAFDMPSDGLLDDYERLSVQMSGASSGQRRILGLSRLFKIVKKPPDLAKFKGWSGYNDIWVGAGKAFVKYVKSLPRTGPATLLLDEPDRSLDLPNQRDFWLKVVPSVGKDVQVIVATHSPFALFTKGAEMLDLVPGYAEESRKAIAAAVGRT